MHIDELELVFANQTPFRATETKMCRFHQPKNKIAAYLFFNVTNRRKEAFAQTIRGWFNNY